jgi:hypothetical protein
MKTLVLTGAVLASLVCGPVHGGECISFYRDANGILKLCENPPPSAHQPVITESGKQYARCVRELIQEHGVSYDAATDACTIQLRKDLGQPSLYDQCAANVKSAVGDRYVTGLCAQYLGR